MNPFPDPETVDIKINQEVRSYMDYQLEATGKVMFYTTMQFFEKAIDAKDIDRSTIIAYYITKSLLTSTMAAHDREFLITGFLEQINALRENREPEKYT